MYERTIEQIIDACLQKWIDVGLNKLPIEIEPEMAGEKDREGWTGRDGLFGFLSTAK